MGLVLAHWWAVSASRRLQAIAYPHWWLKPGPGVSARPLAAELFPGVWLQVWEPRALFRLFLGSELGELGGGEEIVADVVE